MTLDDLVDECWMAMRPSLFRRAILGKRRCAHLVMMSLANFPDRELVGAAPSSAADRQARKQLAATVEAKFRETAQEVTGTYNAVFMTIVLAWAIKLIVAYLISAWFKRQFSIEEIRERYGWKHG